MAKAVRVRFAPSPTGPLHIGGVRTALFNYLFAKKHNGTFVLRIEDTDSKRYVEGAEDYIVEALNWCGIPYDEGPDKPGRYGPYRQSERKELYKQYTDKLIETEKAYYAFDTPERLAELRSEYESKGETFIYNWHNRETLDNGLSLNAEELAARLSSGDDYVIRFKSPKDQVIRLTDQVRGHISIDSNTLDDKVLFKSDGMPTYHLANIVDDHLMQISHVIRGEEWLPSLALHQQLYDAFGWKAPQFSHLPLILKPSGKGKLSKRDGEKLGFPVFPLDWMDPATNVISSGYREAGYFPEAVINFLAFLGWNPGTEQELFSLDELVKAFSIDQVNKSGARFDPDKVNWYNHHYMQEQDDGELVRAFKDSRVELNEFSNEYVGQVVSLIKERTTFVNDFWEQGHFFFKPPSDYDEKALLKAFKPGAAELLTTIVEIIQHTQEITAQKLESNIKQWISSNDIGFGKVMMPLRLSLVGSLQGPDVFQIMLLIGKDETISRIERAIESLPKN